MDTMLNPEADKADIGIELSHITDRFDFFWGILVGMVMKVSGTVLKRVQGAIIVAQPAGNMPSVGFMFNSSYGNAVFFSVAD